MTITPELLKIIEHDGISHYETVMIYNHMRDLARNNDPRITYAKLNFGYRGIFHEKVLSVGTFGNGRQYKATVRPVKKFSKCPPVSSRWEVEPDNEDDQIFSEAIHWDGDPEDEHGPEATLEYYGLEMR